MATEQPEGFEPDRPVGFVPDTKPSALPTAPRQYQNSAELMGDIAVGALKQPGRLVQMIPGVTRATDALFGLQKGASEAAMEPTNQAQRVGGYAADAAETVGSLMASGGMSYARNARGQFIRAPQMTTIGGRVTSAVSDTTAAAMNEVRREVAGFGPVTPTKVGTLVGKYGKEAVKLALKGMGIGAGWTLYEAMKK